MQTCHSSLQLNEKNYQALINIRLINSLIPYARQERRDSAECIISDQLRFWHAAEGR